MLDLKRITENPLELEAMLSRRHFGGVDTEKLKFLIEKVKDSKSKIDLARGERNSASKEIGGLLGQGKKEEAEKRKGEVKNLGDQIDSMEKSHEVLENSLLDIVIALPNFLDETVPVGKDEN